MDNTFFVSPEAARLLREKGYDKPTDYIYVIDGPFYSIWRNKDGNMESNYYPAPTKSEAIDWLECKGIYIELMFNFEESIKDHEVLWCYVVYNKIERCGYKENYIFPTRLEAEEAAIIRALQEIIKK